MTEQQIRDLATRHGLTVEKRITTGNSAKHFATFELFKIGLIDAWQEVRRTEDPDRLRGDPPLTRILHADVKDHPHYGKPFIEFQCIWCEPTE